MESTDGKLTTLRSQGLNHPPWLPPRVSNRKQSRLGRVSVTHFLASARKAEEPRGGAPRAYPTSLRGGCWPLGPDPFRAAGHGVGGATGARGRGEDCASGSPERWERPVWGGAGHRGGRPFPQPQARPYCPRLTGVRNGAVEVKPPGTPCRGR